MELVGLDSSRCRPPTRDVRSVYLDTGSVWINGWFLGGVQAPTGGAKDSGLGRERGLVGIRNILRIKNVAISASRWTISRRASWWRRA